MFWDKVAGVYDIFVNADFKRQFTVDSYREFFLNAGYHDVRVSLADGRIPCAAAVMKKSG